MRFIGSISVILTVAPLSACQCTTSPKPPASISVEAGTFAESVEVKLLSTHTKETEETFSSTVNTEGPQAYKRATYEITIVAGKSPPKRPIIAALTIPDDLKGELDKSKGLHAFVEYFYNGENETHDSFQAVPLLTQTADSVSISLEPSAFTNLRNKSGTYEAVIVLAVGPKQ